MKDGYSKSSCEKSFLTEKNEFGKETLDEKIERELEESSCKLRNYKNSSSTGNTVFKGRYFENAKEQNREDSVSRFLSLEHLLKCKNKESLEISIKDTEVVREEFEKWRKGDKNNDLSKALHKRLPNRRFSSQPGQESEENSVADNHVGVDVNETDDGFTDKYLKLYLLDFLAKLNCYLAKLLPPIHTYNSQEISMPSDKSHGSKGSVNKVNVGIKNVEDLEQDSLQDISSQDSKFITASIVESLDFQLKYQLQKSSSRVHLPSEYENIIGSKKILHSDEKHKDLQKHKSHTATESSEEFALITYTAHKSSPDSNSIAEITYWQSEDQLANIDKGEQQESKILSFQKLKSHYMKKLEEILRKIQECLPTLKRPITDLRGILKPDTPSEERLESLQRMQKEDDHNSPYLFEVFNDRQHCILIYEDQSTTRHLSGGVPACYVDNVLCLYFPNDSPEIGNGSTSNGNNLGALHVCVLFRTLLPRDRQYMYL